VWYVLGMEIDAITARDPNTWKGYQGIPPSNLHPCPSCGHCPTCGYRRGEVFPPLNRGPYTVSASRAPNWNGS